MRMHAVAEEHHARIDKLLSVRDDLEALMAHVADQRDELRWPR
jgi:hypothetical protein